MYWVAATVARNMGHLPAIGLWKIVERQSYNDSLTYLKEVKDPERIPVEIFPSSARSVHTTRNLCNEV